MRELLPDLETWLREGQKVALATVISTWGSAPRPAGSYMAISERGQIAGSVSAGCVEGAVVEASAAVLKSGEPQRLHYGVADETAWDVGLACGGEIDIFLQQADPQVLTPLLARLKNEQRSTLLTTISGSRAGTSELRDERGAKLAGETIAITAAINGKPTLVGEHENEVFINPLLPSPTLVMIGGVHIAVALAQLARTVEFRTIVVDPRKAFNTPERFAHADQIIQAWPQSAFQSVKLTAATAVASLSHDPKIDDPALIAALTSDAFYVGALGSARTAALRRERLLAAGVSTENLARLHAPIGLEINAKTPEEIALAIMADVIASYRS